MRPVFRPLEVGNFANHLTRQVVRIPQSILVAFSSRLGVGNMPRGRCDRHRLQKCNTALRYYKYVTTRSLMGRWTSYRILSAVEDVIVHELAMGHEV